MAVEPTTPSQPVSPAPAEPVKAVVEPKTVAPEPAEPVKAGATTRGPAAKSPPKARSATKTVGAEAKTVARDAASTVKQEAGTLKRKATDKVHALADQGKTAATDRLDGFSRLIEDAAAQVDDRLGAQYGDYARSAANTVAGLSSSLRGKDVDDIVADARAFVKKSPVVAVGAAAAVGFVLARLVKAGLDAADERADGPRKPSA